MSYILSLFIILISVAVYPKVLLQNSELLYIFHIIEVDFFNWYRLLLLGFAGFLLFTPVKPEKPLVIALLLLLLSSLASVYPETVLYGNPMHHEGLFAILGYVGLYQAARYTGITKPIELALTAVVYITALFAILQLTYGNFFDFPLFKAILPEIATESIKWPVYGNLGTSNNLGLLCALLMPFMLVRKKWPEFIALGFLLIVCQTRSAWLSVLITTALISRKTLLFVMIVVGLVTVARPDTTIERLAKAKDDLSFPIKDGALAGRAYMWKRALPSLQQNILLGSGPNTFVHYIPQFHERGDAIGFRDHAIDRPHNLYISIWHSSGLLTLLILLYWVTKKLKNGTDTSIKMAVIGYLIAAVFTDSTLCVTPYLSILLGGMNEYGKTGRPD